MATDSSLLAFLPGHSHGQRSLEGYSPWGCKRIRHDLATKQHQQWYVRMRTCVCVYSVQFSHSVVSDSVTPWTAALQTSLPITNSQTLLKHMSIKCVSSVFPFSSCLQSFPTSGSFPMSQFFT